jgi:hypothetical protein
MYGRLQYGLCVKQVRKLTKDNRFENLVDDLLVAFPKVQRKAKSLRNLAKEMVNTCVYHEHRENGGQCYKVKRAWL